VSDIDWGERITTSARELTEQLELLKGTPLTCEQRRVIRQLYDDLVNLLLVLK